MGLGRRWAWGAMILGSQGEGFRVVGRWEKHSLWASWGEA
jgi:hypothetical protein